VRGEIKNARWIAWDEVAKHFDKVKNRVWRAHVADAAKGGVIVVQELPLQGVARQGRRFAAFPS
jgi:hypothetical protein